MSSTTSKTTPFVPWFLFELLATTIVSDSKFRCISYISLNFQIMLHQCTTEIKPWALQSGESELLYVDFFMHGSLTKVDVQEENWKAKVHCKWLCYYGSNLLLSDHSSFPSSVMKNFTVNFRNSRLDFSLNSSLAYNNNFLTNTFIYECVCISVTLCTHI